MSISNKGDDAERSEESSGLTIVSQPEATVVSRKSPSPRTCRNFVRRETAKALPRIVAAFVGKATEGSVPHFASLTKFGGFDQKPLPSDAPKRRRKTLARQLLDEVEKYEAKQAAELAAANAATSHIDNGRPQEKS